MTVLPFTAMDAISGLAGSSENCALQGRPALSFQVTRTESAVEATPMEGGTGPVMLNGTAAVAIHADERRTMIDFIMIRPWAPLQFNALLAARRLRVRLRWTSVRFWDYVRLEIRCVPGQGGDRRHIRVKRASLIPVYRTGKNDLAVCVVFSWRYSL